MNARPDINQTGNHIIRKKAAFILRAKGHVKQYFAKLGRKERCKAESISLKELLTVVFTFSGGVGIIAWISFYFGLPLLIPSFFASAVFLYTNPHLPASQPRNIVGGHIMSAFVGVLTKSIWGNTWYTITLALVIAIIIMLLTGTLHPPAGATLCTAVISGSDIMFILFPIAAGSMLLVIIAILVINLVPGREYPSYWW